MPPVARAPGVLVAIVGPSGAGKDSLIGYAREHLEGDSRFRFVRRVVTRGADRSEDHDTMSVAAFQAAEIAGKFAVTWQAHGLSYGIPTDAQAHLDEGGVAIVNGSRTALPAIEMVFPGMFVVLVTARPEVLLKRLVARGREDEIAIAARLARSTPGVAYPHDLALDNSSDLAAAGDKLVATIIELAAARNPMLQPNR